MDWVVPFTLPMRYLLTQLIGFFKHLFACEGHLGLGRGSLTHISFTERVSDTLVEPGVDLLLEGLLFKSLDLLSSNLHKTSYFWFNVALSLVSVPLEDWEVSRLYRVVLLVDGWREDVCRDYRLA